MIFLLTGPVHSGKTTTLKKAVLRLKDHALDVHGFLSEAVFEGQERTGYDLFDLKEEKSVPLLRITGDKDWQRVGSYFFIPSGLEKAERILLRAGEADVCVVDEVGPLELTGKGFWPALERVLFPPSAVFLISLRESILEDFRRILEKQEAEVFDVREKDVLSRLTEKIVSAV